MYRPSIDIPPGSGTTPATPGTTVCASDRAKRALRRGSVTGCMAAMLLAGCTEIDGLDPADPGRGPGAMVGNGERINDGPFPGGNDSVPAPNPDADLGEVCDLGCQSYCDALGLTNPVNRGICTSMWGLGVASNPIDNKQACRRLYADVLGRFPTPVEINDRCTTGSFGSLAWDLMTTEEFLLVQRRRWADQLLYNNRAVSIERIYDMDALVTKTYDGYVPWDQFAAVTLSHPVFIRRRDTAGDRAEAAFKLFSGRPPYEAERSDMARLYRLWDNDYWDHAHLGTLPDSVINFRCVDEDGVAQPSLAGECTSVLWGYNPLVLEPDPSRLREDGRMWSGYLTAAEWEQLQLPGRILASQEACWEAAVDDAMEQYFGYDLGTAAPDVRRELVQFLLENNADIRALHYAIVTSIPYLQSSQGGFDDEAPWTEGPLKQAQPEVWLDSLEVFLGDQLGTCDHRMPHPEDYLDEDIITPWSVALVRNSRWTLNDENRLVTNYRNIAQTLGGCPTNEAVGRFTTVSVLNTAVQESYVAERCGLLPAETSATASQLLPDSVTPATALTDQVAQDIVTKQTRMFLGREPSTAELERAAGYADACTPKPCTAEDFARPVCFALTSSAEGLFY